MNHWTGRKHSDDSKRKMSISHKGKVPWNKGIKCPQISKTLTGHSVSKETRDKLRQARLKQPDPMLGKKHSKETLKKLSSSHMGQPSLKKGLTNEEYYGVERAKEISNKLRIARLKQKLPMKDTSIELLIQEELSKRNIPFKKHVPLLNKYIVDLKLGNVIVECDGDYWHNLTPMIKKDKRKNYALTQAGYTVLHFWEHSINENPQECVNIIEEVMSNTL